VRFTITEKDGPPRGQDGPGGDQPLAPWLGCLEQLVTHSAPLLYTQMMEKPCRRRPEPDGLDT
jgi:hypothetical protein